MDIFDIPPPPPHLDNERALQSQTDGFDIAAIPPPPEAFAVSMADAVEAAEATTCRALAAVAAAIAADDKKALKVARADLKLAEATEKAEKRRAREIAQRDKLVAKAAVAKAAENAKAVKEAARTARSEEPKRKAAAPAEPARSEEPKCKPNYEFQDALPLLKCSDARAAFWAAAAAASNGRDARRLGSAAMVAAMNTGLLILTDVAKPCLLKSKPSDIDGDALEPIEQAIFPVPKPARGLVALPLPLADGRRR